MKKYTADFLAALLWAADNPDENTRPLMDKTVHDFSPAFADAVEKFIDAFIAHAAKFGYTADEMDAAERSLGANVYFSLSGHGVGFFDDSDNRIASLHDIIKEWAGWPRFEELDYELEVWPSGLIDLCAMPEALEEWRASMFSVPEEKGGSK